MGNYVKQIAYGHFESRRCRWPVCLHMSNEKVSCH